MKDLVSLIIINWNNKEYLQRCMDSILKQTYENLEIIFIDNKSSDGSFEYFDDLYKEDNIIKIKNDDNLGYSGAANQGIRMSNGKYLMIINPDIIMKENFIERLYKFAITDEKIGAISGKLLKYDFKKDKKLDYIDSAGIIMFRSRRCVDRGQNEKDLGQYDTTERVFGVCGAAPFYKREALDKVTVNQEYFDEDFFAYKEDVDLSWRLNLAGLKCMYYPEAIAYHGRGLGGSKGGVLKFIKNRKTQSEFLRGISFRNHILMMYKNETKDSLKNDRAKIIVRQGLFLAYATVFERFTFKYYKQAKQLHDKMNNKKNKIHEKIGEIHSIKEIIRE